MSISRTAVIAPTAQLGQGVVVGDYCVIEDDVVIGADCVLEPHVYIKRWTTLGARNQVSAGTVLGTHPLDKNFKGARSYLRIGNDNIIREHFTISRGTAEESETIIGDGNYIMTSGHIAHNARIGNNTVIASCSLVAGYVEVEDNAFISGGVAIHQFCRIGRNAMIGGMTRVNKDAPPYFRYAGLYIEPEGLNSVGLRRAGFSEESRRALKAAYKLLFRSSLKTTEALQRIEAELAGEETSRLVAFIRASKRGICHAPRDHRRVADTEVSAIDSD